MLGRSSWLLGSACLLLSDHDIGKAKSGVSGMIRLEGDDRLLGSPCKPIGVSELAQIIRGIGRIKRNSLLTLGNRLLGRSALLGVEHCRPLGH